MNPYQIGDYPPPDPAWDYYEIWHQIQGLRIQINQAIKYMNDVEEATIETNHTLAEHLEDLQNQINSAVEMLKNQNLPY